MPPDLAAPLPEPDARPVEPDIPLRPRAAEPDIPLRPRAAEPDIPLIPKKPRRQEGADRYRSHRRAGRAAGNAAKPAAPKPPRAAAAVGAELDAVFNDFRSEVSKQSGANEAAEYLGLGKTYIEMGMTEEAISALRSGGAHAEPSVRSRVAARPPLSQAGRHPARDRMARARRGGAGAGRERSARAALRSRIDPRVGGRDGPRARGLSRTPGGRGRYRDVAARIERLARVQTGELIIRTLSRLLFAAYFLEAGFILVVAPWSAFWDHNRFAEQRPALDAFLESPYARGGVTGVGVMTALAGLVELGSVFKSRVARDKSDPAPRA